ncbi:Uu.00g063150.m01.CDS01 [Anthostomella pinea]|uniref:6-methylsalicylate decarboxylase n=1 Tax=Anthostomella pinea TaxID=933095 RepID=A0AAI8VTX9_9PEZI|nr:Uu.00g063150.m01.CDS01 [Anthostomella pinea]
MVPDSWSWNVDDSLAHQDKAGVQMQMLSYLPQTLDKLRASNDYAASVVKKHPKRFGMLCALPTDQPRECFEEIERSRQELHADGFEVSAVYKDVMLSDERLETVWQKLNDMGATVFSHSNAYAPPRDGRPAPLIEVAFETCRVIVDMLYRGIFKRYPNIKFVFSHCGGVTPILAGRLELLGAEPWVPNPQNLTSQDIHDQLSSLYVDCAATASSGLQPAIKMVGKEHVVYGADCGVPCSTHATMEKNKEAVMEIERELGMKTGTVGRNGWELFPSAAKRVETGTKQQQYHPSA